MLVDIIAQVLTTPLCFNFIKRSAHCQAKTEAQVFNFNKKLSLSENTCDSF